MVWMVLGVSGIALCFLLLSCHRLPHDLAVKIIDASLPIHFGTFSPGVTIVVIAFSGITAYTSFLDWMKWKNQFAKIGQVGVNHGEVEIHMVTEERDFWRSFMVFVIWVLAWRLKSLTQGDAPLLRVRGGPTDLHHAHASSPDPAVSLNKSLVDRVKRSSKKIWQAVWAFASLVLADASLIRVSFLSRLESITAEKRRIAQRNYQCESVLLGSATGECRNFCEMVQEVSRTREQAMETAHRSHPVGNLVSHMFDFWRGGGSSAESLFKERSCATVLRSVDKSNQLVNYLNWGLAIVAIISLLMAATRLFHSGRTTRSKPDGAAHQAMPDPTSLKTAVSGTRPDTGCSYKFDKDKFN